MGMGGRGVGRGRWLSLAGFAVVLLAIVVPWPVQLIRELLLATGVLLMVAQLRSVTRAVAVRPPVEEDERRHAEDADAPRDGRGGASA